MKIGKNHIELLSNALESGRLDNIESMCFGSSISGLMPILAQGLSGHKGKLRRLKFDLTLLLNAYTDTKPLIEILQCQESNLEELEFHSCLDSVMARQVFKACATTSSHIKVLKMSLCDVNYTHGKVIRKVIESCTYLQHLDLSFNKLGNKGAKEVAEGLVGNTTLLHLNVNSNGLTDDGIVYLAEALETGNNTLQYMRFADGNKIRDCGIVRLAKALHVNTSIRELNLTNEAYHGTVLMDGSAYALAEMLRKNSTLEFLDVTLSKFTKRGSAALLNALHENGSVNVFRISTVKVPFQPVVDLLTNNRSITDLDIAATHFTKDVSKIQEFKSFADALQDNTTIKSLDLGYNDLGGTFVRKTAHALMNHPSLNTLRLDSNRLTDESVISLAKQQYRCQLNQIIMRHNRIKTDGALAIAEFLRRNTSLTSLNISYNDLGKNGVIAIANAVSKNKKTALKELKLHHTYIDWDCTKALCDMILNNNTIEHLELLLYDYIERNRYMDFDYDDEDFDYLPKDEWGDVMPALGKMEDAIKDAFQQNPHILKPISHERKTALHMCYLYKPKNIGRKNPVKKISKRILLDITLCYVPSRGTIFEDGRRHI